MDEGKSPLSHNMYTDSMIGKVAYLYMSDISLYHYFAPNAQQELKEWMKMNRKTYALYENLDH